MKKSKRIIVTLGFLIAAVLIFVGAAVYSYGTKREECFQRLVGYTGQMAEQIRTEMSDDKAYLVRFARQLSRYDLSDTQAIAAELSIRGDFGLLSQLELLLPGDQMLLDDGTMLDASGILSFDQLQGSDEYISRRTSDMEDPERQIIRHCVPLTQNGQVVAILCGVIDLADMPAFFDIYDYGDNYFVFVFESSTGNYIQDTWHDTLSSVGDFGKRKVKDGYSLEEFEQSVSKMDAASLVFLSETAGEYFYSYVAPVGVEDWMVMVNVLEPVVFAQANEMMTIFLIAAILLLVVFGIYFIWILKDVRRENVEKERQIRNVSYMLAVEKLLFDAHIYPEHFFQALGCISEYLSAESALLWLTDDHQAVDQRYWHAGHDFFRMQTETFREQYPQILAEAEKTGGFNITGKKELLARFPVEGKDLADRHIHSLMMIPVYDVKGRIVFVLGACNLRNQWNNLEPLRQVALSFSMTINHYEAYHALQMMGTTDALTGLLNRNSYNKELDKISAEKPQNFGCIYMDVNGLHEINNYMGHQAGDQMLQTVARVLTKWFADDLVYRIGGDEFVVFCKVGTEESMRKNLESARAEIRIHKYELSVGAVWASGDYSANKVIESAEMEMRQDKKLFYSTGGKERSLRQLNEQMERMIKEKQDAEAFLASMETEFKGVYFVDLNTDQARHLFIPDYFRQLVEAADGHFSQAMRAYARQYVMEADVQKVDQLTDYEWLKQQLDEKAMESIEYHKKEGGSYYLRILKLDTENKDQYETQWIFKENS